MFHFSDKILNTPSENFCGISAIFFQCCFMSEAQVLMTVSDLFCFFFWKGALLFKWGASFLSGGGMGGERGGGPWGEAKKIMGLRGNYEKL